MSRQAAPKKMPVIRTMGVVLPKNDLTQAVVREHVRAVQEFDHRGAHLLERFVRDMANLHKTTDDQKKKHSYLKMAADQLYDLDNKVALEFHKPSPPLFMTATHGYILAELCEIRGLLNAAINCNETEHS